MRLSFLTAGEACLAPTSLRGRGSSIFRAETQRTPRIALSLLVLCASVAAGWGQSHALPSGEIRAIYQRLLAQIEQIKIFDHHAHPGWSDDPDIDAQVTPPIQHLPLRARE